MRVRFEFDPGPGAPFFIFGRGSPGTWIELEPRVLNSYRLCSSPHSPSILLPLMIFFNPRAILLGERDLRAMGDWCRLYFKKSQHDLRLIPVETRRHRLSRNNFLFLKIGPKYIVNVALCPSYRNVLQCSGTAVFSGEA